MLAEILNFQGVNPILGMGSLSYKYIFRNISRMNIMDSEVFYEKYISEDFETKYVPKIFEDVCRQYLIRKNRMGCMDEIFEKNRKVLL